MDENARSILNENLKNRGIPQDFSWTGPGRDKAAERWRRAADHSMKWLIEDLKSPTPHSSIEKAQCVRQLTQSMMALEYHGHLREARQGTDSTWLDYWRDSLADPNDRIKVVALLGRARARQKNPDNHAQYTQGMGHAHADHWLSEMMARAWFDVPMPEWMPAKIGSEMPISDGNTTRTQHLYRPWRGEEGMGLHEDLVVFLTNFCEARAGIKKEFQHESTNLAKVCVLLRALGVVAPERMPKKTVQLIDETEQHLDMSGLAEEPHISIGFALFVQALWDQQVLERVDGNPPTDKTSGRRTRTL